MPSHYSMSNRFGHGTVARSDLKQLKDRHVFSKDIATPNIPLDEKAIVHWAFNVSWTSYQSTLVKDRMVVAKG